MSTDPVVAFLAKQSASRLREMREQVQEQEESLRVQVELLDRALAEKGHSVERKPSFQPRSRARGNKRAIFREILSTQPDHPWLPSEVKAALAERGIDSSSAAIRVMLRRMADNAEVVRGEGGNGWKLASANGSRQESLAEGTSSGPGGYGRESALRVTTVPNRVLGDAS